LQNVTDWVVADRVRKDTHLQIEDRFSRTSDFTMSAAGQIDCQPALMAEFTHVGPDDIFG